MSCRLAAENALPACGLFSSMLVQLQKLSSNADKLQQFGEAEEFLHEVCRFELAMEIQLKVVHLPPYVTAYTSKKVKVSDYRLWDWRA